MKRQLIHQNLLVLKRVLRKAYHSNSLCHDGVIKWKQFPRHRWIPLPKASDAELRCFLSSALHGIVEQKWRRWWFHLAYYDITVMRQYLMTFHLIIVSVATHITSTFPRLYLKVLTHGYWIFKYIVIDFEFHNYLIIAGWQWHLWHKYVTISNLSSIGPQNLTLERSTLVQTMAWYRQATSH